MSTFIHKYTLRHTPDVQTIKAHKSGGFLSFQNQREVPTVWIAVEPASPPETLRCQLVPTGAEVPDTAQYLGTAQFEGGALVLHLFALPFETPVEDM